MDQKAAVTRIWPECECGAAEDLRRPSPWMHAILCPVYFDWVRRESAIELEADEARYERREKHMATQKDYDDDMKDSSR